MTKETRTLIDLKDILGIEIECQKCKAKVMLPISSQLPDHNYRCFQCYENWFGASFNPETSQPFAAAVNQINDLMRRIKELTTTERSDIHVPIRFHIVNIQNG